ncbi:response regulator, partial [Candidatus Venteria ishoeyi]|uniref:response regulator n=1 Tax=Candidatus Venteria ishoeyi TaxID=1899563 RepID=UPI000A6CC08E
MQLATQTFNKILVVDDIEANIDILLIILKDYDVTPVNSGEAALAIVEEKTVDLILLDIIMPTMSGFEVCERLKANDKTRDIPVIFFTVKNDEESMEQAYKMGGFDYVTKPFKPRELLTRVRAQLKFQKMFHELKLTASRDKLTGTYNQQTFMEMAQNIYAKADNQLFMMILNIDAFQAINEQHGTYAGEQALKRVIWFITHLLPHNAILGRMDGAVFATLFQV